MHQEAGHVKIDRRMNLEGRVNLIFEEVSPTITKITANSRYVITRTQVATRMDNSVQEKKTDTISFDTGAGASFSGTTHKHVNECVSTGALEREILAVIK